MEAGMLAKMMMAAPDANMAMYLRGAGNLYLRIT